MSSEFKPAIADDMRVLASPEDSSSALMSTTSSIITPSTTQRGFELPYMEVAPRILILGAVPNVPETFCTETPADLPSRLRLMSAMPSSLASSAEILSVAPVNNLLSIFCMPVTTTLSSTSESLSSETFISLLMGTLFSLVPKKLKIAYLAVAGTLSIANLPFMSVNPPILVPSIWIEAPATGVPSSA